MSRDGLPRATVLPGDTMEILLGLVATVAILVVASKLLPGAPPAGPNVTPPAEPGAEKRRGWPPTPYQVLQELMRGDLEGARARLVAIQGAARPQAGEASAWGEWLRGLPAMPRAGEALDEFCEAHPNQPLPRLVRGAYLVSLGQRLRGSGGSTTLSREEEHQVKATHERAWADLRHAHHLAPEDPEPSVVALRAARLAGDRPSAERAFRDATRARPTHLVAHHEMLRLLTPGFRGDPGEATRFAREAVAAHAGAGELRLLIAWAHLEGGDAAPPAPGSPEAQELAGIQEDLAAAFSSSGSLLRELAEIARATGDEDLWEGRLRQAAALGEARAQLALGLHLDATARDGRRIRDRARFQEAMEWMGRAAAQGAPEALAAVGVTLRRAGTSEEEARAALAWLHLAADRGSARAWVELGQCYAAGEGVPLDPREALRWYQGAVELGSGRAAHALAGLHGSGSGGLSRDDRRRANWMREAARLGHLEAQFEVGKLLLEGVWLDRDPRAGHAWIRAAAGRGHEGAQVLLERVNPSKEDA